MRYFCAKVIMIEDLCVTRLCHLNAKVGLYMLKKSLVYHE